MTATALAAGLAACEGDSPGPVASASLSITLADASPPPHQGALPALRGAWEAMPPSPLEGRELHTATWTGSELVVWGGLGRSGPLADGAAFDPASNKWQRLPPAPIQSRSAHGSVWTGREVIVWGGLGRSGYLADGAAYDPDNGQWRLLSASGLDSRAGASVLWTGTDMIVWGGHRRVGDRQADMRDGAVYDPATDTWRGLPAAPLPANPGASAVWAGNGLIAVSYPQGEADRALLAETDPEAEGWISLIGTPAAARLTPSLVWTGKELLMLSAEPGPDTSGLSPTAAYSPSSGEWRIPTYPPAGGINPGLWAWTGRYVVFLGSAPAAYDPASDRWASLPQPERVPEFATVKWIGDAIAVWGGDYGSGPTAEGAVLVLHGD